MGSDNRIYMGVMSVRYTAQWGGLMGGGARLMAFIEIKVILLLGH